MDLQCLLHIVTLHQQALHPDHAVPEVGQDCDTGSRNWILNCDHQYHDTFACLVPLDARLTPQPAFASLHSLRLVHCIHGRELPHPEPVHANHDHKS